jgi:hypothetical protein
MSGWLLTALPLHLLGQNSFHTGQVFRYRQQTTSTVKWSEGALLSKTQNGKGVKNFRNNSSKNVVFLAQQRSSSTQMLRSQNRQEESNQKKVGEEHQALFRKEKLV